MEYEIVDPAQQRYVSEPPVVSRVTSITNPQHTEESLDAEIKLATTVEAAIGCTLAAVVFIIVGIMLCRRSGFIGERILRLCSDDLEDKLKRMKRSRNSYEAIEVQRDKKKKLSSTIPSFSSLAELFPRSKSNDDVKKVEGSSPNVLTIPSTGGGSSPAITRSVQHGNIPFTLPPMIVSKSSSTRSGFFERVQPYHPRSFSENDARLSPIPPLSEGVSDQAISEENISDTENPLSSELDKSVETAKTNSRGNFRNSLLGQIQPELYKYSEHEEHDLPPSQFGRVWFTLVYDAAVEALTVKVIKVRQLSGRGSNVPHDCFVKLFLLPDERMSQQTKVKRRTNNPRFNETFVFQVIICLYLPNSLLLYDKTYSSGRKILIGFLVQNLLKELF